VEPDTVAVEPGQKASLKDKKKEKKGKMSKKELKKSRKSRTSVEAPPVEAPPVDILEVQHVQAVGESSVISTCSRKKAFRHPLFSTTTYHPKGGTQLY
jgi:hypothetical protein